MKMNVIQRLNKKNAMNKYGLAHTASSLA